jgi:hypothetical protein
VVELLDPALPPGLEPLEAVVLVGGGVLLLVVELEPPSEPSPPEPSSGLAIVPLLPGVVAPLPPPSPPLELPLGVEPAPAVPEPPPS